MDCTPLLTGPQIECSNYRFSVAQLGDPSNTFDCDGIVMHSEDLVVKENPGNGPVDVPIDVVTALQFDFEERTPSPDPVSYEIHDLEPFGDFDGMSVSLDGLPPGEPIVRTVKLPPEVVMPQGFTVQFPPDTVPGTLENLYVLCDLDRDGVVELAASMVLRAVEAPGGPPRARASAPGTATGVVISVPR